MTRLPATVKRIICYVRKSREDEEAERRGEDTLQRQRALLVEEILPRYALPYDMAEEIASGDTIAERPIFQDVLARLGTTYQAVVCKDLSRLGRGNYGDMAVLYDTIRWHRIIIITQDATYDPANFSDLRMIRFSLFFNREEYEMIRWRLNEGKYAAARKGRWVAGTLPFGYRRDPLTHQVVADERAATVVRKIFSLNAHKHFGYRAIADELSRLCIPSPRQGAKWHPEVIRRILKNPVYVGTLTYRKTSKNPLTGEIVRRPVADQIIVEHAFPAIIDEATWQNAQVGCSRYRGNSPVRHERSISSLGGLIRCADCNQKLIRQVSSRSHRLKDGGIRTYAKETLYCKRCAYTVQYHTCEQQLTSLLSQCIVRPEPQLTKLVEHLTGARDASTTVNDEQLHLVHERRLHARYERAKNYLLDGVLSAAEFVKIQTAYHQELHKLKQVSQTQATMTALHQREANSYNSLADIYLTLNGHGRNQLLTRTFDCISLRLKHRGLSRRHPAQFDLVATIPPNRVHLLGINLEAQNLIPDSPTQDASHAPAGKLPPPFLRSPCWSC